MRDDGKSENSKRNEKEYNSRLPFLSQFPVSYFQLQVVQRQLQFHNVEALIQGVTTKLYVANESKKYKYK